VISPDLSLYENLSLGFSSMHALDTYVHTKIQEADPMRRHALAAHALCTYLRGVRNRYHGEMVTTLSLYVDALQSHEVVYELDGFRYDSTVVSKVVSRCSLLTHVVVARVDNMSGWLDHELDYLRLPLGFLGPHAGTELELGFVEGWIIIFDECYDTVPTPVDDYAYMEKGLENSTVVVFQVRPQDILQTKVFPLMIVKWSPAGTKRFFPINEAVQQRFRKSHSHRSWKALRQEFNESLAEGFTSSLPDMTREELEEIKRRAGRYLTVIEDNKPDIDGSFILSEDVGQLKSYWSYLKRHDDLFMEETADLGRPFVLSDEGDEEDERRQELMLRSYAVAE